MSNGIILSGKSPSFLVFITQSTVLVQVAERISGVAPIFDLTNHRQCGVWLPPLLALASLNFHTNISDSLATNNLENSDGSQGCVGLPPPRLGFVSCCAETLIGLVSQPEKELRRTPRMNERASNLWPAGGVAASGGPLTLFQQVPKFHLLPSHTFGSLTPGIRQGRAVGVRSCAQSA